MRMIEPEQFITEVPDEVQVSVLPHLVAIYDDRANQIGTGFLTMWHGKQLLVTAKHCLYGHKFDENPAEKRVHLNGDLKPLGEIARSAFASSPDALDVVVVHVEGFDQDRVLPYTALQFGVPAPGMVTIVGFLSRDFHRNQADATLRPKPFCYTNVKIDMEKPELVGIKYTNRAITTTTGQRDLSPTPRGLSGTAMLNTAALLLGQIKVCGIFTDERLSEAHVFGTHVNALADPMESLLSGA
ncbi:hypothetical protein O9X90_25745 [Agrobacterium leguminum]|uniref:hypothetical protein n=1 Tax=Agrobacterium leguminum TaxID=2792015 RepID=UPI0022B84DA3|nr:hypothetical protein [Agrobacterium leguminum]MCZ7935735.1 hypothetical protein [Agrobacterium leguminum]